ncbi:MAG: hypothetical protein AAGK24_06130, partial [Planctomycetota bacterium]
QVSIAFVVINQKHKGSRHGTHCTDGAASKQAKFDLLGLNQPLSPVSYGTSFQRYGPRAEESWNLMQGTEQASYNVWL